MEKSIMKNYYAGKENILETYEQKEKRIRKRVYKYLESLGTSTENLPGYLWTQYVTPDERDELGWSQDENITYASTVPTTMKHREEVGNLLKKLEESLWKILREKEDEIARLQKALIDSRKREVNMIKKSK